MGACCCSEQPHRERLGATTEPLLKDSEREAVSTLLRYFDQNNHGLSDKRLQSLQTLAYSDNVDLQRSAAICYSEISETLREPVTEGFLGPVVHLLLSSDMDTQKSASLALSNLALHGPAENKVTIVRSGALPPLISLLSTKDVEVQCNACGCITTLATTETNKLEIAAQGGIPALLRLTHNEDSRVQRNAAGALLNLTHLESNRQQLVQAGAVPVFIRMLESQDRDVQFYSAAALSNLAVHGIHRQTMMVYGNGKVLKLLITLMTTDTERVCCQACLAIRNLASDESNQGRIVAEGGLNVLVPLMKSKDLDTITAAVAALRNLSIRKGNEVPIVRSGVLSELRRLVSLQEFPEVQCHAAGTIRNLAAEDQCVAVIEAGCLITLAEQLRDQRHVPEVVLSETSAAMAVLASHPLARRQIMDLFGGNFYKVLIRLTDSPYKEVQYNCAGVIGHLAINEEYHVHLLDGDPSAIDFISRFMQSDDVSYVHLALWIMAQFSNGSRRTRNLLRRSVLMEKIVDLRSKRDSIEIAQLADAAFNNLEMMNGHYEHDRTVSV